jgi:hypothetical protein
MSQGTVESENLFLRILHSFCVFREYAKCIEPFVENLANFGLFEVHKIVSEYAERVHMHTRKRRKDIQRRRYLGKYVIVQHEINFLILTFYTRWVGCIKLKNISRYCPFKKIPAKLARCSPSYDTTPRPIAALLTM